MKANKIHFTVIQISSCHLRLVSFSSQIGLHGCIRTFLGSLDLVRVPITAGVSEDFLTLLQASFGTFIGVVSFDLFVTWSLRWLPSIMRPLLKKNRQQNKKVWKKICPIIIIIWIIDLIYSLSQFQRVCWNATGKKLR